MNVRAPPICVCMFRDIYGLHRENNIYIPRGKVNIDLHSVRELLSYKCESVNYNRAPA